MRRVSIITALHSKGPYVAETIRSVLAQTMPDWEMIVVENGSTDDGPEIVRQLSNPRMRLVVSPKQGPGVPATLVWPTQPANGSYFWMQIICWYRIFWKNA